MADLTINHVLTRLLRESTIEAARHPSLYQALLDLRTDVEAQLCNLGMELVLMTDVGVAHARNMSEERLDALAEELGCEAITPACSHQRLSYYDSVAVVYFRLSLDQELRQGSEEIWLREPEVLDALGKTYSDSVAEDRITLEERIQRTLRRLQELNLIDVRPMGRASLYRGRPLLQAAFSRDQIAAFAAEMNLLADDAETPREPRGAPVLVDLDPGPSELNGEADA